MSITAWTPTYAMEAGSRRFLQHLIFALCGTREGTLGTRERKSEVASRLHLVGCNS
jgi:hypothetical protein